MKILICANGYNTLKNKKIGIFQLDQAKALREIGHDVRISTIDTRSIRRIRNYKTEKFELSGILTSLSNFPFGNPPVIYKLRHKIGTACAKASYRAITNDGWKPDIVHAHFCDIAADYAEVAAENELPFVVTEHFSKLNAARIDSDVSYCANKAYSAADQIIAVSYALRDSIKTRFGFDSVVIPNIVDMDTFYPASRKRDKQEFVFLTAGNLIYRKGMDLLLSAFSEIKYDNTRLVIMGNGPERKHLESMAAQLGISDRVVFSGEYVRSEFQERLADADCFVLASRCETFGVVYVEAMAAGKPVIGTVCGGPEEIITRETGLLVPVDDKTKLIDALERMYENADGYRSDLIADYARCHYDKKVVAKMIERVYKGVLNEKFN